MLCRAKPRAKGKETPSIISYLYTYIDIYIWCLFSEKFIECSAMERVPSCMFETKIPLELRDGLVMHESRIMSIKDTTFELCIVLLGSVKFGYR